MRLRARVESECEELGLGLRRACHVRTCLPRSSSAHGTGRARSDVQEGQNHSPAGMRFSGGSRQRLRTKPTG